MQKTITTTLLKHQPPKTLHKLIACMLVLMSSNTLLANPTNGIVSSGTAEITANGSTLTIHQVTPNTTIQWQTFSIQNGEAVTFTQPSTSSVAVNRVTGGDASQILGTLSANGQVFLINPNGVMFGNNAVVNTAGLIATTLDLTQADFATGHYTFSGTAGSVSNAGKLNSPNGYVVLMGNHLNNTGTISTTNGTSALIAGSTVTLGVQPGSPLTYKIEADTLNSLIESHGAILTDKGTIVLDTSSANGLAGGVINVDGLINGQLVTVHSSGTVSLNGNINAPLGTTAPITTPNVTPTGNTIPINSGVILQANGQTVTNSGVLTIDSGSLPIDNALSGTITFSGNGGQLHTTDSPTVLSNGSITLSPTPPIIPSGNAQIGSGTLIVSGNSLPNNNGQSGTLTTNGNGNGHIQTTGTSTNTGNNPTSVSSGTTNTVSSSHAASTVQPSHADAGKSDAIALTNSTAAASGVLSTQAVTSNHSIAETAMHDAIQAATSATQP